MKTQKKIYKNRNKIIENRNLETKNKNPRIFQYLASF